MFKKQQPELYVYTCFSFSPITCWSLNRFTSQSRHIGKKMVLQVLWCQMKPDSEI